MILPHHFKGIAEILNKYKDYIERNEYILLVNDFCFYFLNQSKLFDIEKFKKIAYKDFKW